MTISSPESEPLNPSAIDSQDPELDNPDIDGDARDTPGNLLKSRRDPLYILILYGLSCLISLGALSCAMWGYSIVIAAPFDEWSKKHEREGYEKYFWGMQSIVVLNSVNIVWSGFNFRLALKGRQLNPELLWLINMVYDFLLWATLIGFGVFNMIEMLWDRRLCDGLPRQGDPGLDRQLYDRCDKAMFRLLVVEMVAVNLGLLVAVLHFIQLISRCCTCGSVSRHWTLRERIQEEEEVLLVLMERRRRLVQENEELEARMETGDQPLPDVLADENRSENEIAQAEEAQQEEEDLIDMAAEERGNSTRAS